MIYFREENWEYTIIISINIFKIYIRVRFLGMLGSSCIANSAIIRNVGVISL